MNIPPKTLQINANTSNAYGKGVALAAMGSVSSMTFDDGIFSANVFIVK
ncbi:hypothetical protein FACS1894208_12370 [Clostridia bacterium]|nr:hypothetical protein FACS1894208_12370 [Clostridia bacterium]